MSAAANALFSGVTGCVLAAAPQSVSAWMGHPYPVILQTVGVGLIAFSALLIGIVVSRRERVVVPVLICAADALWVVSTALVAVLWPAAFSSTGWIIASAVAVVVLALAIAQYAGLMRRYRPRRENRDLRRVSLEFEVDVPMHLLWSVFRNVGDIHIHAPNLANSEIINDAQNGREIIRECRDTRARTWREHLTIDDSRTRIDARFDTERPEFPFPAKEMFGVWELLTRDGGTRVRLEWDLRPINPKLFVLTAPVLAGVLAVQMCGVVQSMATEARADAAVQQRGSRFLPFSPMC